MITCLNGAVEPRRGRSRDFSDSDQLARIIRICRGMQQRQELIENRSRPMPVGGHLRVAGLQSCCGRKAGGLKISFPVARNR